MYQYIPIYPDVLLPLSYKRVKLHATQVFSVLDKVVPMLLLLIIRHGDSFVIASNHHFNFQFSTKSTLHDIIQSFQCDVLPIVFHF